MNYMPRNLRLCPPDIPQHIVQRGNNRQLCFFANEDFAAYAHWLHEGASRYNVMIHAWVFMTNHVHLLVTPKAPNATAKMMQYLGRFYVRYFNHKYDRSGTLWEGRYHSSLIEAPTYFLNCQRYIELNPVRAGMAREPAEYKWSSYQANGLGVRTKLHTPHELYLQLGTTEGERIANYQNLFESHIDGSLLSDIRRSIHTGLLGANQFRVEIEAVTGHCLSHKRRGPKKK
jgi:putative transposase